MISVTSISINMSFMRSLKLAQTECPLLLRFQRSIPAGANGARPNAEEVSGVAVFFDEFHA